MNHRALIRRSCLLAIMLLLCMIFAGAGSSIHAASRTRKHTVVVGEKKQLKPAGASRYKSKKPSVVRVSAAGQITALKKGTCKITAVRGKKKLTWKIKVVSPSLNKKKKKLDPGRSFTLKLKKASGLKYTWSVSDPSVLKLTKKSKTKYKVKAQKSGTATVIVSRGSWQAVCTVIVNGVPETENSAGKSTDKSTDTGKGKDKKPAIQTLYMDNNVFKQMTWKRSDVGEYISSLSNYGQSAPLYIHKDGGDGLENIWAATNNGAVGVAGAQLSDDAVKKTIEKACFWARAVCDSPYHGYDYGHSYKGANLMYTFGQAKPNGLGTGDYCCSTIPLCAYYFAGVNVIGENLGGADAKYIPNSTKLFYEGSLGEITYYENGKLKGCRYLSNYEWKIFRFCGFKDMIKQYNKNPKKFKFKAGDVVTANGHTQLVIGDGTRKKAEAAQAYGHEKVKKGKMPKGGDQAYELGRSFGIRTSPKIRHIMRFTGAGVRLNTVGLTG